MINDRTGQGQSADFRGLALIVSGVIAISPHNQQKRPHCVVVRAFLLE